MPAVEQAGCQDVLGSGGGGGFAFTLATHLTFTMGIPVRTVVKMDGGLKQPGTLRNFGVGTLFFNVLTVLLPLYASC